MKLNTVTVGVKWPKTDTKQRNLRKWSSIFGDRKTLWQAQSNRFFATW